MIVVTVDVKERFDYSELQSLITASTKKPTRVETKQMDVADIRISVDGGKSTIMFLERKTLPDLAASLRDGRYAEQKIRQLAESDTRFKGYVIERTGPLGSQHRGSVGVKQFYGVLASLSVKSQMQTYVTNSSSETLQLIASLCKKLLDVAASASDDDTSDAGVETASYYERAVKHAQQTTKAKNVTPELCYKLQLAQIPGISVNYAACIASTPDFSSMVSLVSKLSASSSSRGEALQLLADVKVSPKRRLGKVRAARICEYFCYCAGATASAPASQTDRTQDPAS
jgi:ERCC4-type nuclease